MWCATKTSFIFTLLLISTASLFEWVDIIISSLFLWFFILFPSPMKIARDNERNASAVCL